MPQQLDDLIFDRTGTDVQRVKLLTRKLIEGTATGEEKAEWLSGTMKGAYNAGDLNRVGAAVKYLTDTLYSMGYHVPTTAKTDWTMQDIPVQAQMEQYIENVRLLRECLPYAAPDVPENAVKLTFQEANNMEEILYTLERVLLAMQEHFKLRQANTLFMIAGGLFNNA